MVRTTEWTDGDILYSEDLEKEFGGIIWNKLISTTNADGTESMGFQAHTTAKCTMMDAGADIWYSDDAGITWTEKNTDLDPTEVIHKNCKADREYAVFIEMSGDNEVVHTADAGVTCTTKTSCTFGTSIAALSYPTTGLIVVGGNDAAGTDHIVYSTDSGANWTNANTTVDAACVGLDMFSLNIGFAVTSAGKIFKSGATYDDWTDTTHTVTPLSPCSVAAISTTECIIAGISAAFLYIFKYDGSGNAVQKLLLNRVGESAYQYVMAPVIDSNGVIYTGCVYSGANAQFTLIRSTDDGETWEFIMVPCTDDWDTATGNIISALSLDEDDNLYVFSSQHNIAMKFPRYK